MRILVVEDEPRVSSFLLEGLRAERFDVDLAEDGHAALDLLTGNRYDLIVLDLMIPKLDGIGVLTRIRQKGFATPVLVLTAKSSVEDRVKGLEAGADDYVVKPFSFEELLARIRALLRRGTAPSTMLRVGDLELDRVRHKVRRAGRAVELTQKEFAVLECLMENVDQPVTRAMLFERVWNSRAEGLTNLVDVYVNYLRTKIDKDFETRLIQTVRGVGYRLVEPDGKT
jgi:two-component system copper resistance phosphate regulon response regulator CusR